MQIILLTSSSLCLCWKTKEIEAKIREAYPDFGHPKHVLPKQPETARRNRRNRRNKLILDRLRSMVLHDSRRSRDPEETSSPISRTSLPVALQVVMNGRETRARIH